MEGRSFFSSVNAYGGALLLDGKISSFVVCLFLATPKRFLTLQRPPTNASTDWRLIYACLGRLFLADYLTLPGVLPVAFFLFFFPHVALTQLATRDPEQ